MTLLSFIFTSRPSRLEWREEEKVKDGERGGEGELEERKEKCLGLQIRYKGETLILGWGINEASAGYDSGVSGRGRGWFLATADKAHLHSILIIPSIKIWSAQHSGARLYVYDGSSFAIALDLRDLSASPHSAAPACTCLPSQ
ncbi:unnamed protein product [Pleuronectes platessa]|uniref:Uncharacterized protein n=1 Tax=Pleuronectes platessa TaxID=8262 RepID=A0A9N7THT6_PLEPL|nr:unnamed protein product [Pleuronectes platessa]